MTENSPERVREIFKEAIELVGEDRDAFVSAAVGDDETLRNRVDRLLQAYDIDASNLGQTEVTAITTGTRIGGQIGRFRVLQKIGEGGFGEVWMAEQTEPIRRRVAIKIIKPGMDSEQVIARFEAERQALAMMEHANIARVYDGGETDEGRPYFVMELVKGMPITEYCDRKNLDLAARIELFRQVCAGVQHAHQKGVIHRDLKPNNVLVCEIDDKPVPKVIDFGIAKALERPLTDKTLFTEFRQFIGTPEYMSPEQAELSLIDVDTRSDVYALGVMLYELLAGQPPFDPKSLRSVGFDEMRRIIREEEPPPPSSKLTRSGSGKDGDRPDPELGKLGKLVRGELDWIVQRAMAKERDRRYASANELEEDLSRYLRSEPVRAGRPGRLYRTQRFVRRNRVAVSFAATGVAALLAIAVLLAIGLIVLSGNYEELQRAQASERAASQKMEESLAARTAALAEVESAQAQTQSALEDAERARDHAEAARTSLDDQVSAMHIARAAELAQSEEMQAIAQLDLVRDQNRNWAWKTLRSSLPTRTEIGLFEDAIICDVTRQGDHALILRLDEYTLRCDVVSLPDGELVSNLYSENYESQVEPITSDVNGISLPAQVTLQTAWGSLTTSAMGIFEGALFSHMSFSVDGRRVVLPQAVFDYFRSLVGRLPGVDDKLEKARAQANIGRLQKKIDEAKAVGIDATDMEQELRGHQMVVDAMPVQQTVVSHVLLSIFDAASGDLVATMPRTAAPRSPFEGLHWVADDAATRVLTVQKGDRSTGDVLLMLLAGENRVLESAPLQLQIADYGTPVPLTLSADGEMFAVAMTMARTRRERVGMRGTRQGDGEWERSPLFKNILETRHRVAVGQVVDGELEINEILMGEADFQNYEKIQSLAFTVDDEALFVLEGSGGMAAYRPEETWWNDDDNLLRVTGVASSVFAEQVGSGLQNWNQTNTSPPAILRPVGEDAVLVSDGSRIVQIDVAESIDDEVAEFEVVKRFDLGDARILLAEPPAKEHEASLISWSDERITRVQLGARVATIEEVVHAYPTSSSFVHGRSDSLELITPLGAIASEDFPDVPWSVSPTGQYAIMPGGFVVDVATGERHALAQHWNGSDEQSGNTERVGAKTFQEGCWVQSGDGRELILALLTKGPGAAYSNDASDPHLGMNSQLGALGQGMAPHFLGQGVYCWDAATGALEDEALLPIFFVDAGSLIVDLVRTTRSGDLLAVAGQWNKMPTMPSNIGDIDSFISSVMKDATQAKQESALVLVDRKTGEILLRKRMSGAIGGLALSPDGSEVACYLGGSQASETARVVLLSKDPNESWLAGEPNVRTNNVTDAYLSEWEVRGINRPTPILSYSPDGSLLSLLLESRIDLMDPRSNTWLLSWDLEAILGMAGMPLQTGSAYQPKLKSAAFGSDGRALNIWADDPRMRGSSILIRIFDAPVSATEVLTSPNGKIDVSFEAYPAHGTSDNPEAVVVRND